MSVLAVDFKQSRSAEEQRQIRAIVRKIKRDKLTKGQRDVLTVIVNQWFHHRNGPEGVIRPGKERIAKRANVCIRTVATALELFRSMGIICAVQYAKGGTKATRYTVNLTALRDAFDPHGVQTIEGVLVPFQARASETNCTVCEAGNCTVYGCKNCTRSKGTDSLSQAGGGEA